jgi:hypothetical protein
MGGPPENNNLQIKDKYGSTTTQYIHTHTTAPERKAMTMHHGSSS